MTAADFAFPTSNFANGSVSCSSSAIITPILSFGLSAISRTRADSIFDFSELSGSADTKLANCSRTIATIPKTIQNFQIFDLIFIVFTSLCTDPMQWHFALFLHDSAHWCTPPRDTYHGTPSHGGVRKCNKRSLYHSLETIGTAARAPCAVCHLSTGS